MWEPYSLSVCLSICPSALCCNAITQKAFNLTIKGNTFIFSGQQVKGQGNTDIFCNTLLWHSNSNSFDSTDLILHTQKKDNENKIPIDFGVKRSKVKVILTYSATLCCNTLTQRVSSQTDLILHTQMEDKERKIPIDFGIKRLKVKVKVTCSIHT